MSLSPLPLSYCTNVHAGRSVDEVERGLAIYTRAVRERLNGPLAAGLWLARTVASELLADEARLEQLGRRLVEHDLTCYTLNAFPYGDFHSDRVKDSVFLPDWAAAERLDYTRDCAMILATLMEAAGGEAEEGSISTMPLGFKEHEKPADFRQQCMDQLLAGARTLDEIRERRGRTIRLAIEPEPYGIIETTPESIAFFRELWDRAESAGVLEIAQRHLGLCYDICHQAVEFEDVAESIGQFEAAGVRINKVHITSAIELERPAQNCEARAELARYVEPRYLHQTMALGADGSVWRARDLSESLALDPPDAFVNASVWRVHFHVPVDAEEMGLLSTTRDEVARALAAVAALPYTPHLEVETYTWPLLREGAEQDLAENIAREMLASQELLAAAATA